MNNVKKTSLGKIHQITGYISNIYLVEEGGKYFFVDPGVAGDVPAVEEYITATMGLSMKDISFSVVSHMHPDHAGGAVVLRKKHGIPIAAHRLADRWYCGFTGFIQHRLDCIMTLHVGLRKKRGFSKIRFRRILSPEYSLKDGDVLPEFPDWKVVHIPGHTSHDIVFFNEQDGVLFGADSIVNMEGVYNLPIPIHFYNKMRRSFDRLAGLPVKEILLGHGEPISTDDPEKVFSEMKALLDRPLSGIARKAKWLSVYSSEIWRPYLRKRIHVIF